MPAFDRLSALAGKAVDRLYGEAIRLVPRHTASQYGGPLADPGRQVWPSRGTFSDDPSASDLTGQRKGGDLVGPSRLADGVCTLQIFKADADLLPWIIRKGDLIELTDRVGPPAYNVIEASPLDFGDILLILSREGTAQS